ncbi:MAG: helix-turn-helix domain-containing protein [Candidatus Eremiobacteraeota bacterium]|nr:helix-turn-helix domain-containing protein [Candidatus Eremiobacteraeota bacterium]
MKYYKKGFKKISRDEYEFLIQERAKAKKRGDFKLDKRLRAITLVGYKQVTQVEAARRCEIHVRNLRKWLLLYREGGYEELTNFKYNGRPSRLNDEQLNGLKKIVEADPDEQGYDTGIWTAATAMNVIFKKFCVKYSASMVQKILRKKNSPGQTPKPGRSGWIRPCPNSSK